MLRQQSSNYRYDAVRLVTEVPVGLSTQLYISIYILCDALFCYRDSSVGIATGSGMDGPGIDSRWGRDFPLHPEQPWGPPSLVYSGDRFWPGVKAAGAWR
jgi:hypothetical protein